MKSAVDKKFSVIGYRLSVQRTAYESFIFMMKPFTGLAFAFHSFAGYSSGFLYAPPNGYSTFELKLK